MTQEQGFMTDEWMRALQEAMKPMGSRGGGKTVKELSASTGISEARVRVLIAKLSSQGRISVKREIRMSIDGRGMPVPAYLVVDPQEPRS